MAGRTHLTATAVYRKESKVFKFLLSTAGILMLIGLLVIIGILALIF